MWIDVKIFVIADWSLSCLNTIQQCHKSHMCFPLLMLCEHFYLQALGVCWTATRRCRRRRLHWFKHGCMRQHTQIDTFNTHDVTHLETGAVNIRFMHMVEQHVLFLWASSSFCHLPSEPQLRRFCCGTKRESIQLSFDLWPPLHKPTKLPCPMKMI